MRSAIKVLAIVAILGLVGQVFGHDAPAKDGPKPLMGKLTKVDTTKDAMTITITVGKGETAKDTVIKVDEKTEITVDGTATKIAVLKAEGRAKVTLVDGSKDTAAKVEVTTKKPGAGTDKPADAPKKE